MSEELRQKALKFEVAKQYPEAAEIYRKMNLFDKAAFMFQKADTPELAIALFEDVKQFEKAAAICLKCNRHAQAGALFERIKKFEDAAKAYVQAKDFDLASRTFIKAGKFGEAGELYLLLRNYMEAGKCFDKAGNRQKSAQAYKQIEGGEAIEKAQSEAERLRVVQILDRIKRFEKAADMYLHGKELIEAIGMYLKIGELAQAARLYSNCQGDIGFELIASVPREGKAYRDYADMFMLSRDYAKAGRVYEDYNDYNRAGEAYEKCDDYYQAAECYLQDKAYAKAARMFEKFGEHEKAAQMFEDLDQHLLAAMNYDRADRFFKAGELYIKSDRVDKAIEVLQKITEGDINYLKASAIIADVLKEKGHLDLALDRYEHVVAKSELSDDTILFYYNLALIFIEKQRFDEAENLFKKVANYKFNYKDVMDRLNTVKKLKEQAKKGAQDLVEDLQKAKERLKKTTPSDAAPEAAQSSLSQSMIVGRMEGFEFLKNTSLFASLTLDEMKKFWDIAETHVYPEETTIIEENTEGKGLYILKTGGVRVVKEKEDGTEEILTVLYAGDCFGEMSLINDSPTTATVKAAEEVEVFLLSREKFDKLMETSDKLSLKLHRAFIKTLTQRLIRTSEDFMAFRNAMFGRGGE